MTHKERIAEIRNSFENSYEPYGSDVAYLLERIANYERLAEAVKERHRLFMSPRQDETMKDAQAVYEEEIKALAKCEPENAV